MFLIAQRFGVTLNALIAANPQVPNPNLIFPGQVLCVPSVPTPPTPPPPPPTCNNFYYTVVSGDTLSSISAKFGVSVSNILTANPQITNPNVIFAGQVICIPLPIPPATCSGFFYTVVAGDTLTSIAAKFGTTVTAIQAANPQIINPNLIYAGQVICIPTTPPPPPPPPTCNNFYYTVVAGDTLSSISARFGVSVSNILTANPQITNPNLIYPGQIICIPLPIPPATCSGFFYTVVAGDTLASIATKFGTTVSAILAVNPQIINPNIIYAGQVICIPGPVTPPPPPPTCTNFYYTVVAGDTLSSISTKFGVSVSDILTANPQITNPNVIFAGQVICIPLPIPPKTCSGFFYTVVRGDTLASIARRFGTTVTAIMAANPQIINPNIIYVGQVICIPASTGAAMDAQDPGATSADGTTDDPEAGNVEAIEPGHQDD